MSKEHRQATAPGKIQRKGDTQINAHKTCLLVLGMHRSGTSAFTKVLSCLGAGLPRTLMPPIENNNITGFWESQTIAQLNDELLDLMGLKWDDWYPLPADWQTAQWVRPHIDKAVDILEQEFGDTSLFVLKDPRVARLVPFWRDALTRFGAKTKYLLPYRDPRDVAASLHLRDGFPLAKGYLLWLTHVLDAERATRSERRFFARYDDILTDWRGVVEHCGETLGLSWPKLGPVAAVEIDGFLDQGLRHHHHNRDTAGPKRGLPAWIEAVYVSLSALADGNPADEHAESLDSIRIEWERASALFGELSHHQEQSLIELKLESDEEASTKVTALAECDLEVEELRQALRQARTEQARLEQELEQTKAQARAEQAMVKQALAQTKAQALAEQARLKQALAQTKAQALAELTLLEQELA